MQSQNRFFDDLARLGTSAMGLASGVRETLETEIRDRVERMLSGMDLPTREELEVVRAMTVKARDTQEAIESRLAAIEARLDRLEAGAGGQPAGHDETENSAGDDPSI